MGLHEHAFGCVVSMGMAVTVASSQPKIDDAVRLQCQRVSQSVIVVPDGISRAPPLVCGGVRLGMADRPRRSIGRFFGKPSARR